MTYLKRITILLCFSLTLSTLAFAYRQGEPVLDMRNVVSPPKNFRITSKSLPSDINTQGLASLHMAGGAQFSKLGLQNILERIPSKEVTIIDLRQESHGFVNGNAISWYAQGNAANLGLTPLEIENLQSRLLSELDKEEFVKAAVILTKTPNQKIAKTKLVEFYVRGVSSEAELAEKANLKYERIYVVDHKAPPPKEVDRFIDIVKQIPANEWIYFHCRAGVGRTTTFMAMYDMMKNAKQVSFNDILARQAALGGKDLSDLPGTELYKHSSAKERLAFLKRFYQYAKENTDHFQSSFTAWNRKHRS